MKLCRTPFFVWFTGRTGSTLLCDLLDSHPQIHCRKEVFSAIRCDGPGQDPDAGGLSISGSDRTIDAHAETQFVREIVSPSGLIEHPTPDFAVKHLHQLFASGRDACGFKLKYPSQSAVFPEIMRTLAEIDSLRVIRLSRKNVLKQAISLRNVNRIRELGVCLSGNATQQVQLEPIRLDLKSTIADARFFLRNRRVFREQVQQFKHIFRVTYEQLQQDRGRLLRQVLRFLKVDDSCPLSSDFRKITPDRIQDAVSNYDELAEAVRGTNLEVFLD